MLQLRARRIALLAMLPVAALRTQTAPTSSLRATFLEYQTEVPATWTARVRSEQEQG